MANQEYKIITAQYNGHCSICGNSIERGDRIKYAKGRPTIHADCTSPEIPSDAIRLEGGSGYGCQGWTPKTVIKNPNPRTRKSVKRFFACAICGPLTGNICLKGSRAEGHIEKLAREEKIETPTAHADEPEFLFVLTASQRYIREDGLSFGVGDESGYVYSATCRAATDEESKPLRAAIAASRARIKAGDELQHISRRIIAEGEWPEPAGGQITPEGETIPIGSGQTIYGGGRWFVVGPEYIWLVINNGADGDDWSANNVRTGGAGAIGRRVPATPELAEQIKSLALAAGFIREEK
jgi:hypothetical protein